VYFLNQAINSTLQRRERDRLKLYGFAKVIILEDEIMGRCEYEGR
jgi:hypothetical protein